MSNSLSEVMNACTKLWRSRSGTVAAEFALVAVPFLMLTTTVLETGMFMYRDRIMEGAVQEAAREIRTGVLTSGGTALETFNRKVCAEAFEAYPCVVAVDVRTFGSFGAISLPAPEFDPDTGAMTNAAFNGPGNAKSVVVVRIIRQAQFSVPGISGLLGQSNSPFRVYHTSVFKTEPF